MVVHGGTWWSLVGHGGARWHMVEHGNTQLSLLQGAAHFKAEPPLAKVRDGKVARLQVAQGCAYANLLLLLLLLLRTTAATYRGVGGESRRREHVGSGLG